MLHHGYLQLVGIMQKFIDQHLANTIHDPLLSVESADAAAAERPTTAHKFK